MSPHMGRIEKRIRLAVPLEASESQGSAPVLVPRGPAWISIAKRCKTFEPHIPVPEQPVLPTLREPRNGEDKKASNTCRQRKIWIDLDISPHMPFCGPIIDELQKRGSSVVLTARECFHVHKLGEP